MIPMKKLLSALLICGLGFFAVQGVEANCGEGCTCGEVVKEQTVVEAMEVENTKGIVEKTDKDYFLLRTADNQLLQVNVSREAGAETGFYKAKSGKVMSFASLKAGDYVAVVYKPQMSRSIPPQVPGVVVLQGKADAAMPAFYQVKTVSRSEDGAYIQVADEGENLLATIDSKACKDYTQIKAGNKLLLWYSFMTMSLPPKTNAAKAVILR